MSEAKCNKDWEPSIHAVICSAHFVDNQKSEHSLHPSYVPTIFREFDKKLSSSRFYRHQRRNRIKSNNEITEHENNKMENINMQTDEDNEEQSVNYLNELQISTIVDMHPEVRNVSCQTNNEESPNCSETYFFCALERVDGICNAQLQVNIITNKTRQNVSNSDCKKIMKDVACDAINSQYLTTAYSGFRGMKSINDAASLNSLSGLSINVFNYIVKILNDKKSYTMSKPNRVLLFLMKIKLGLTHSALAVIFGVHRTTSKKFIGILESLNTILKNFIFWPSKETVKNTLPEAFKRNYPQTRVIIYCTEIKTETPYSVKNQVLMYSQYKNNHTVKFLVASTPNGFISFVSKCYGGRTSDSFITNDCGLLDLLEPNDVVLADKGFPSINVDVEKHNAILVIPPFLSDKQFTADEVEETYKIASVRIHIERIIQRIKEFIRFLKMPINILPYVDQIVFVSCALINLQTPIINEKKET
ncbi:LOW QUALITY PROTEIN: uncharacterized protein [Prorops nasuta]|uniref:LOW QUALITY PROTEIN: uncharacterized protein n=1 Tax=Prorops nasuta TaxID=863751 RepID=UPI0034CD3A9C